MRRDRAFPKIVEIKMAVKKLKNNKAAGIDKLRAEYIKGGGDILEVWLQKILNLVWKERKAPGDWLKAIIMPLFKKGER